MNKSLDDIRSKLLLDNHHKMERFCVIFVIFMVIFGILLSVCIKNDIESRQFTLTNLALYTRNAKFSKTGENVKLLKLYRNDDFSKAFILMQVGSSSTGHYGMSNLSIDANDYTMFMTGSEGAVVEGNPTGGVYIFGNTGYIGAYFADSAGFKPMLYDILLRCNKQVTGDVVDPNLKSNQIRFFVNFAGKDGTVANFLNMENPSLETMYAELFLNEQCENIKSSAAKLLRDMVPHMALLKEQRLRLETLGLQVPELPVSIRGDYITDDITLTENNPVGFDKSMINSIDAILPSSDKIVSVEESANGELTYSSNSTLYLVTDYVFPGGCQYNASEYELTDNLSSLIIPEDMTYAEWSQAKSQEKIDNGSASRFVMKHTWKYKSGAEFKHEGNNVTTSTIQAAINDYEKTVSALYSLKYKYQVETLPRWFQYDDISATVDGIFSIQSNSNTLVLY
ncbi:hypothetical protein J6A31_07470 [bacterium]|nr:hypothetical protein [bacterium]